MKPLLKRLSRVLASLVFLGGAAAFSALLWVTRPVAEKKPPTDALPVVQVEPVRYGTVSFDLPTQGAVEARRRSELAAEVPGKVVEVNPDFEVGMRLPEETWLVRLDPTDYRAAVAAAAASLAEAEAALASEEARAEQARSDWRRLGHGGEPPDLTVRGPQVRSAKARVASAAAALERAESDLGRCEIRTPFDCVVSAKRTDLGSYLVPGAGVTSVFAAGPFEVRLPLQVDRLQFLDLEGGVGSPGGVTVHLSVGGETLDLPARIVRAEGEIDQASRSAYFVAEIDASSEGGPAIQPGLFVRATIRGRPVPGVAKIPFPAFVDLGRIAVVAPDDTLQFRDVTVVYREGESVYVSDGVAEGERLCLTELPSMIRGLRVSPLPAGADEAVQAADATEAPDATPIPPAP